MSRAKPSVVFCLGPPGSGKGTQCTKIVDEFSFVHLSAGDCLREALSRKDETSELIDSYIREGKIVPVRITVELLKKKMEAHGWHDRHFLIDGFPRNQDNLDGWYSIMPDSEVNVIGCLFLSCADDVVIERLLHRGETSGRVDDNRETIAKRLKVYHEETTPIIERFNKSGKCFSIDTTGSIESVWADVKKLFEETILPLRG
ncbi:UMP-CMP kinase [Cryptosporidium felis]|nr:UMP-CMP kinase [Cryptosporidium felis]